MTVCQAVLANWDTPFPIAQHAGTDVEGFMLHFQNGDNCRGDKTRFT